MRKPAAGETVATTAPTSGCASTGLDHDDDTQSRACHHPSHPSRDAPGDINPVWSVSGSARKFHPEFHPGGRPQDMSITP